MSKTSSLLASGAIAALVGCSSDLSSTESSDRSEVLTLSRPSPRIVVAGRSAAVRVATDPITRHPSPCADRLPISSAGASMAAGPDLELLSLIVACALPATTSLIADVSGGEVEIFGELGLASEWIHQPLRGAGARWVSACVISRLSGTDLATVVSLRGQNRALRTDADERSTWTIDEGAFYGDLFASETQPIRWFGCRGRDANVAEVAGRVCTIEAPETPGVTRCGLTYAGPCDQACGEGRRNCGAPDGSISRQVISARLAP